MAWNLPCGDTFYGTPAILAASSKSELCCPSLHQGTRVSRWGRTSSLVRLVGQWEQYSIHPWMWSRVESRTAQRLKDQYRSTTGRGLVLGRFSKRRDLVHCIRGSCQRY